MGRLILSRRVGQTIHIGDDVAVTVLGVRGGTVSIGIHAPKEVPILRHELYRPATDADPEPPAAVIALPRRR